MTVTEHNKKQKSRKEKRMEKVLDALQDCGGIVSSACKQVGIGRATYYKYRNDSEKFAERADRVIEHQKRNRLDVALSNHEKNLMKEDHDKSTYFELGRRHPDYIQKFKGETDIKVKEKVTLEKQQYYELKKLLAETYVNKTDDDDEEEETEE